MSKTFISINAIAATVASDKVLRSLFSDVLEGNKLVEPSPREAVNVAIIVCVANRSLQAAFAARVGEAVSLGANNAELEVDLSKVAELKELCEKLGKEAYAGGQKRTMKAWGLDDAEASNARVQLHPLLEAIAATVRAQSASLKG